MIFIIIKAPFVTSGSCVWAPGRFGYQSPPQSKESNFIHNNWNIFSLVEQTVHGCTAAPLLPLTTGNRTSDHECPQRRGQMMQLISSPDSAASAEPPRSKTPQPCSWFDLSSRQPGCTRINALLGFAGALQFALNPCVTAVCAASNQLLCIKHMKWTEQEGRNRKINESLSAPRHC